ncbi:MAG: hypothetical protein R3B11_02975 [Nitrospira sp.]|nr:hypothetical protein [Nitrospira sp.]MDR4474953.1 hypothetical protein [Nitrospira sp.]
MTMLDDPVMALRIQLQQLSCPACGAHELMLKLQCDYYPDGCLWFVSCGSCRTRYHLDHRTVPAGARLPSSTSIGNQTSISGL